MADRPLIIGEYAVRHRVTSTGEDRYSGVLRGLGDRSEKTVYNATTDRNEVLEVVLRKAMDADDGLAEVIGSLSGDKTAENLKRKNARIESARRLLRSLAPSVIHEDDPLMAMCEKLVGYVQSIRDEADIKGSFVPVDSADSDVPDSLIITELSRENERLFGCVKALEDDLEVAKHSHDTLVNRVRELESANSVRYIVYDDFQSAVPARDDEEIVFSWDAVQKIRAENCATQNYTTDDERVDCALTEFVTRNYATVFETDFPIDEDPSTVNSALQDFATWIQKADIDQQSYRAVEKICEVAWDESTPFDVVDIGYAASVWCGLLNPKGIMQAHAVDGVSLAITEGDESDLTVAAKHLLESV